MAIGVTVQRAIAFIGIITAVHAARAAKRLKQECRKCPRGRYMPLPEGVQCLACLKDRTTREVASESESDCLCAEGSFMCGRCLPCPAGLECPAGLDPPNQTEGYWFAPRAAECEFQVLRCRNGFECQGANGERHMSTCAPGRQGLACNDCMPSHYSSINGRCEECGGADTLPAALFLLLTPFMLIMLVCCANQDPNQESLNRLTATAIFCQILMSLQALGSMKELSIDWQDPVRRIIQFTRFLTFDFDIIRISCFLGADSRVLKFVCQLLACPLCCALLVFAWFSGRLLGHPRPFDRVINMCGLLLFAFFLSITLSTLLPFQCAGNPDGSTSMVSDPGILCYTSQEHQLLVLLSVLGILSQPLAILSWATYATIMYPSRITSGVGLRVVNRYRFLFHRFKPECYYYGLVLLYRNGMVALLPSLLVDLREFQVPTMGIILWTSAALQARIWPWRTDQANLVDVLLASFLLIVLLGAAPLLVLDRSRSALLLGWLLVVPIFGLLLTAVLALMRTLLRSLSPQRVFGVFLCHHKGTAGSLCRLIKILIARHSSINVFLDSDELENLDLLFDIIRTSTKSVLVILTAELPKRIWCAGEIVTAFKNSVLTVPAICDGFYPPSAEQLEILPTLWAPQQTQLLANSGVELKDVAKAYYWLLNELSPTTLPRFGPVWKREASVVVALKRCGAQISGSSSRMLEASRQNVNAGARILITSSVADAESLSTCEVFQNILQSHLHVECAVVHNSLQMVRWKRWAYYFVVLFFRGMLRDPLFAEILDSAFHAPGRSLEVVTVLADPYFDFRSAESYAYEGMFRDEDHFSARTNIQRLAKAFRTLLMIVALPFTPVDSFGLQKKQVSEIALRFRRYKERAAAAAMDEADDDIVRAEFGEKIASEVGSEEAFLDEVSMCSKFSDTVSI
eukprot:s542_g18.t1